MRRVALIDLDALQALRRAGEFEAARTQLIAAIEAEPEDPELRLELGHTCRLIGDFVTAEQAYADAWAWFEADDDPVGTIDAMLGLASVYRATGAYSGALGLLDEAKELIDAIEDRESLPHWYWTRGTLLRYSGQLREAEIELRVGLDLARELEDTESEAYLLAALGGLMRVRGEFAASAEFYERAYIAFEAIEDAFGLAYTACGRANAARMQGDFGTAERYFAEAAERYETFGDKVSYAYTLWAWAVLATLQGEPASAAERLDKAAALFAETGDRRGQAYVELARAQLQVQDGRLPEDERVTLRECAAQWSQRGLPFEAAVASYMADPSDAHRARISELGSAWEPDSLPLNIP
ncbi:MAG: tetratricopeptide repeat protein [Candidatus Dadabacteria bacterium]|nr:MAG: tetratricopeptide repeat protein [Candidatus Dadabacteria bacterium]